MDGSGGIFELLDALRATPWLWLAVLGLVSFVWADFALLCGGALASGLDIPAWACAGVLLAAAFGGDTILYALGRFAGTRPAIARRMDGPQRRNIESLLHRHFFAVLFLSRFVPAMRVPAYMLVGGLSVPYAKFAGPVAAITFLWCGAMFWIGHRGGQAAYAWVAEYKLYAVLAVAVLAWGMSALARALLKRAA